MLDERTNTIQQGGYVMSVDDVEESIKLFPQSTLSFRAGPRSVLAAPMIVDRRYDDLELRCDR